MQVGRITFGPTQDAIEASAWRRQIDKARNAAMTIRADQEVHACNCIGPQPGESKCPCQLRGEAEQGRRMISEGVVINGVEYDLVPRRR